MATASEQHAVTDPNSGLLVGAPIGGPAASAPVHTELKGRLITIVPVDPEAHSKVLFETTSSGPQKYKLWQYMMDGPWDTWEAFHQSLVAKKASTDPLYFTVVSNETGQPLGLTSYLNIRPAHGVIEVGSLLFSPALQRTSGATEAMYLMMKHAFEDLHYRRYEWKANSLNKPSLKAAERLGFVYEGTFRNHMIIKGHNRDTTWFSITDAEWPERKRALEEYLGAENFDENGQQRQPLRRREA
ncbi:GCN5-related N-acetyltransferase [Thozetella sp. PMI_491]|nr:GCN5-related N-acetyltransferase [Thozetella sp. PMI_491]